MADPAMVTGNSLYSKYYTCRIFPGWSLVAGEIIKLDITHVSLQPSFSPKNKGHSTQMMMIVLTSESLKRCRHSLSVAHVDFMVHCASLIRHHAEISTVKNNHCKAYKISLHNRSHKNIQLNFFTDIPQILK